MGNPRNIFQNSGTNIPTEINSITFRREVLKKERHYLLRYHLIIDHHKEKATQQFKAYQLAESSKFSPYAPYNIMEELNKNLSKMTMFDALRILGQLELLQEALKLKDSKKRVNEGNIIFAIFDDVPSYPIGIRIPPPFYLSLRLES